MLLHRILRYLTPRAPIVVLVTLGVAVLFGLPTLLMQANGGLHGWRVLVVAAFGALGAVGAYDGASRLHHREARSWVTFVTGGLLVSAAVVAGMTATAHSSRAELLPVITSHALRMSVTVHEPEPFAVAFPGDIGLPSTTSDWASLHARGGVDVEMSAFRLTLSNQSVQRLDISGISLKVIGSSPPPKGSIASLYTQGDEPLKKYAFQLTSAVPNARAQMYDVTNDIAGFRQQPPLPPHFVSEHLFLAPGEIYPASFTVESELSTEIAYRLEISFSTARADYTVVYPATFRISGFRGDQPGSYGHLYLLGHPPGTCAADVSNPWVEFKPDEAPCAPEVPLVTPR